MWNYLGSGLPSRLDTAAAQLPFQKLNHGERGTSVLNLIAPTFDRGLGRDGIVMGSWGIYLHSH